jgi:DNA recombination protein RmuC
LGNKGYWNQFADAPEFVIMFIPGEHFLNAALDHDPNLWEYAFERHVLLATPTNLIAIARTVEGVWRQEKIARQAAEIAQVGKQLYARLAVTADHMEKVGRGLRTAVAAYNGLVGNLDTNVLASARKLEALDVETGGRAIESPALIDEQPREPAKLLALAATSSGG